VTDSLVEIDGRQLKLSNLEKVLYPETGFAKGEVIDYYARIAPAILPHLYERPVTRMRAYLDAMDAATAFQAAARQSPDKAWALHDKMYENNTALTRADIEKYAEAAGLNMARFKKDWDDPKIKAEVEEDSKIGTAAGANGTPTFPSC